MIFKIASFEDFSAEFALLSLIKHLFCQPVDILLIIKFKEIQFP